MRRHPPLTAAVDATCPWAPGPMGPPSCLSTRLPTPSGRLLSSPRPRPRAAPASPREPSAPHAQHHTLRGLHATRGPNASHRPRMRSAGEALPPRPTPLASHKPHAPVPTHALPVLSSPFASPPINNQLHAPPSKHDSPESVVEPIKHIMRHIHTNSHGTRALVRVSNCQQPSDPP